jgi:hypothetical protein
MDSDILFYQDPVDIIAAASRSSAELVDRFNEDIVDSYTWSAEQVREALQIDLLPRINVGVGLLRRDSKAFDDYEGYLGMPVLDEGRRYFLEQSLTAIASPRTGVTHLSPAYDVAGRLSPDSIGVISQHYCDRLRPKFYLHFCERLAGELGAGQP